MYLIDPLIGHTAAPNSGQSFRYPVGIGQSEEGLREEGLRGLKGRRPLTHQERRRGEPAHFTLHIVSDKSKRVGVESRREGREE